MGAEAVIPPRSNQKEKCDHALYRRGHNRIERMFGWLKKFQGIATNTNLQSSLP
jgi:transposase